MKLSSVLFFILFVFAAESNATVDFNPAVLWPVSGDIAKDPFALQVYAGVNLFEIFQKAPVQKYRGPDKQRSAESILKEAANLDSNPIFTFGYAYSEALMDVAPDYPDIQFVAVDGGFDRTPPENISVVEFANEEGAYLMGILAAFTSKSDKVGFIGGMNIEAIRDYGCGYIQGGLSVKPHLEFTLDMISSTALGFDDPQTAKTLALAQYEAGADIVFHAAGGSGLGLFDAAEQFGGLAIGVDSNQNAIKPGLIVSSLLKRIDVITYNLLKKSETLQNLSSFEAGIKEGAFDWVIDEYNLDFVNLHIKNAIDRAMASISTGAVEVKKSKETPACIKLWQEQL